MSAFRHSAEMAISRQETKSVRARETDMNEWVCCCRVRDLQFGADSAFPRCCYLSSMQSVHAPFQKITRAQINVHRSFIKGSGLFEKEEIRLWRRTLMSPVSRRC